MSAATVRRLFLTTLSWALGPGCHGSTSTPSPSPVDAALDLADAICEEGHPCVGLDSRWPSLLPPSYIGIQSCVAGVKARLFGMRSLEDADSRRFKWSADVPLNGVFPSPGIVAALVRCDEPRRATPVFPFVSGVVGMNPRRADSAKLADIDDVFIPFTGEASIDDGVRATATLDPQGGARPVSVTVSIAKGAGPSFPALQTGGHFAWGGRRATVVRIVEPRGGVLGEIGWVEVSLSGG